MSKPPKVDFKALVAGTTSQPAPAPERTPMAPVMVAEADQPTAHKAEVVELSTSATQSRVPRPSNGRQPLKKRSVQQSLYLEEPVYEQLRELSFHERKAMHALVLEGLDMLFKKRGLKAINQLKKSAV